MLIQSILDLACNVLVYTLPFLSIALYLNSGMLFSFIFINIVQAYYLPLLMLYIRL